MLEGCRGTGKSRFLQEITRAAQQRSFTVFEQRALVLPTESGLVGPTHAANVPREPDGLPRPEKPPVHAPGSRQLRGRLTEQLDARIEEHSALGPVLVAIDDAHHADPAWLPVLSTLTPPVSDHPLVWALTRQAGQGGPHIDRLFGTHHARVTRIELGPLGDPVVDELVTDLVGAKAAPDLLGLVATAGGNPLLIRELVQGLVEEQKIQIDRGTARLLSRTLPQRMHSLVQDQLRALSVKSRQLLQVAAALGKCFAVQHVAEMLHETTATLLPALEETLSAGLLVGHSERLTFSHEIVWQAVTESMPQSVRVPLCHEAARILSGTGPDHGGRENRPGVRADRSADLAPAGSARTSGADEAIGPPRVLSAIDNEVASGKLAVATTLAQNALTRPMSPLHAVELRCRLAHIMIMSGRSRPAVELAEQALAERRLPDTLRAEASAARVLALSLHDEDQARREAETILADPHTRAGDPSVAIAGMVLSNVLWKDGELAESLRLAREAVVNLRTTTPSTWRTHVTLALARKLSNRHEIAAADVVIQESRPTMDPSDLALHTAAPAIARARLLAQAGRLSESRVQARSALAVAQESGAHLLVPLALSALAMVALRTGDLLTAAEYVRRCRVNLATGNTPLWSAQYDWVELLLAAEQDGPRRAMDLLENHHSGLPTRRLLFIEEPGAAAWLVRLALTVGDAGLARTVLRTAEELATRNPDFPTVVVGAKHARGLLDGDAGALANAASEHLEPWAAAWAAEDLGVHILGAGVGGTEPAVAKLGRALKGFEHIGAERDAARVRNRLRALGVRRQRLATPKTAALGWSSLNDMERTIAHLVSQGLTNRQIAKRIFLSPHTVNYHLRQTFRKLDIRSRMELARLTQEHLPQSDPLAPQSDPLAG
ncbi:regulatory LuxR family protein [Micromonospora pisi]|uniref:Regulatory LuxR family protein n=1 Tax=Micromonospora pisi TaxID=589240 RepID=A0A495JPC5_9ACTN|nr:regulatory LuxR family protein [Micromonospora pisi]